MKILQLPKTASFRATRIVCAGLLALNLVVCGSALAQPKMNGRSGEQQTDRTAMMSKRMFAAIEKKTGKPLTATQKQKLMAALKTRAAAHKAANDKFAGQVSSITGIKPNELRSLGRGGMRGSENRR